MKNGLGLFFGGFAVIGLSAAAVVIAAHSQLGSLQQYKDPVEETLHPASLSGLADRGRANWIDRKSVV